MHFAIDRMLWALPLTSCCTPNPTDSHESFQKQLHWCFLSRKTTPCLHAMLGVPPVCFLYYKTHYTNNYFGVFVNFLIILFPVHSELNCKHDTQENVEWMNKWIIAQAWNNIYPVPAHPSFNLLHLLLKKKDNKSELESLVLSPKSANQDLISNLIVISAFPKNVNSNQLI